MADTTFGHVPSGHNILLRGLRGVWNWLIILGESSHRAQLANRIAEFSDEDLERHGTTRAELIRRVMIDGYGM